MRTLPSAVIELVQNRVLAEIPNVQLRRFKIHPTPRTDILTCSTHPFNKLLFNPDSDFEVPFLQRITFPLQTMPHLPSAVGGGSDTLTQRIDFILSNVPYRGFDSLLEFLEFDAVFTVHLDRAEVVLETFITALSEMGTTDPHLSFLNGDFTAGASVGWFTGIIDRVISVADTIECRAISVLPVTPWKLVPDDGSDPRDRGTRLPLVMGSNAVVQCVNLQVGAFTSLSARMPIDDDKAQLEDSTGFASSGSAMVAGELISYLSIQRDDLLDVSRGLQGTSNADHIVGTPVIELQEIVLGVSSVPVSGVLDLFIFNSSTGVTSRINSLLYDVENEDESTLPGVSGDPITTITISEANLAAVLHSLFADAAVIQQAVYGDEAVPLDESTEDTSASLNITVASGVGATGTWSAVTTTPNWVFSKTSGNQDGLQAKYIAADFSAFHDLVQVRGIRFTVTLDVDTISTPITVGLVASGYETVLSGFVDGGVVASEEIDATGVITITGELYGAIVGSHIRDIHDGVITFINGDVPGGNPAIDFDVTSIGIELISADSVILGVITDHEADDLLEVAGTLGPSGAWIGDWTIPGSGSIASMAFDSTKTEKHLRFTWTQDPLTNVGGANFVKLDATTPFQNHFEGDRVSDPDNTRVDVLVTNENNPTDSPFTADEFVPNIFWVSGETGVKEIQHDVTAVAGKDTTGLVGYSIDMVVFDDDDIKTSAEVMKVLSHAMRIKYDLDSNFNAIPQVLDAQIQASPGGVSLQFYAVCDGPEADDGTWNVAEDEVLEHPGDLMRFWLEDVHGLTNVDSAGFSATAYTDATPGYQFGFDARNLGGTFEEVLLRLGYEGSANVMQLEDEWTLRYPKATFDFDVDAGVTLDSLGELVAIGKDTDEIRTRLTIFSHFDPRFDSFDNRAFTQVQNTDPTDSAVEDREDEYGRLDQDPQFLFAHNLKLGVTNFRLYQEQELGRPARVFSFRIDHWQGYALEVGDVRNLSHPRVDGGTAVKVRIIEVQNSRERGIRVRAAEVL